MTKTEQDLREIHGDEFADEMAEMASEENTDESEETDDLGGYEEEMAEIDEVYAPVKSLRSRVFDFLSHRMVFYAVGLVDGVILTFVVLTFLKLV